MTAESTGREVALTKNGLSEVLPWAQQMAQSGFFRDVKNPAQALVKIMAGHEMGFGVVASLSGVHIIEGVPTLHARLQAAKVKQSGKYDYRIKQHDETLCAIEFFEIIEGKRESLGESVFTMQDAENAGLLTERKEYEWREVNGRRQRVETGRMQQNNYQKFPRNMLFARAMTNGIGWFCPDVFSIAVYTPEEINPDLELSEDGRIVNVGEVEVIPPREQQQRGGNRQQQQQAPAQQQAQPAEAGEARTFANPGAVGKAAHDDYGLQPSEVEKILGSKLREWAGREDEAWAAILRSRANPDTGEVASHAYPWQPEFDQALGEWELTAQQVLEAHGDSFEGQAPPIERIYARLDYLLAQQALAPALYVEEAAAVLDVSAPSEATADGAPAAEVPEGDSGATQAEPSESQQDAPSGQAPK